MQNGERRRGQRCRTVMPLRFGDRHGSLPVCSGHGSLHISPCLAKARLRRAHIVQCPASHPGPGPDLWRLMLSRWPRRTCTAVHWKVRGRRYGDGLVSRRISRHWTMILLVLGKLPIATRRSPAENVQATCPSPFFTMPELERATQASPWIRDRHGRPALRNAWYTSSQRVSRQAPT